MNNIANVTSYNQQGQIEDKTGAILDLIFGEIKGTFPAWRQSWRNEGDIALAKGIWLEALIEAGINTMEAVKRGLRKCRESKNDLIPNVGQFVDWCKLMPAERGFLDAEQAYISSYCLGQYYGSNIYDSDNQEMIVRYTIHLCGGSTSYRAMDAKESKKAFIANYRQAFERWLEMQEWNKTNDKLNMHLKPYVEPERMPLFTSAPAKLATPATPDISNNAEPTPYEQFKIDVELCKQQKPANFGEQFRHLTPKQHVAKIMQISSFAQKGTLGASVMKAIDPKFTPPYQPELTVKEKMQPELTREQQVLRAKAAIQDAKERWATQCNPESQTPYHEPVFSQEPDQPQEAYPLAVECNTYQALSAFPENHGGYETDLGEVDRPLSLPVTECQGLVAYAPPVSGTYTLVANE